MYKGVVISLFISLVVANKDVIEFQQSGVAKPTHQQTKPSSQNDVKVQQAGNKEPAFCNKLDCPAFTVVQNFTVFEERKYTKSVWVTTTMTGIDYKEATYEMFMKLFHYIQGENVDKKKIKMTAPVITRIIPGQGPACDNNFTMSFFISPKVTDPPKATDASIKIEEIPEQNVYVKGFGGFAMNYDTWKKEALSLITELEEKDLVDYETDYYYTAGYNSPFQLFNRHNEVWFLKK